MKPNHDVLALLMLISMPLASCQRDAPETAPVAEPAAARILTSRSAMGDTIFSSTGKSSLVRRSTGPVSLEDKTLKNAVAFLRMRCVSSIQTWLLGFAPSKISLAACACRMDLSLRGM